MAELDCEKFFRKLRIVDFIALLSRCQFFEFLQLFDGHNGFSAAIYSKENLLNNVLSAIPPYLNRDEWIATLPRALVDGLVKTDKDFQEKGLFSLNRPVAALEFYALAICRSYFRLLVLTAQCPEAAGSNRGNGLAVMVGQD
ncbi:hypothetical protein JHK82_027712 [Glycine max]|nr:hypothetical protein JHK82_027712 [Glycine max]